MRYRNVNSGAVVDVRDDKAMDAEWESVSEEKKAPAKRASSSSAKSDK